MRTFDFAIEQATRSMHDSISSTAFRASHVSTFGMKMPLRTKLVPVGRFTHR